MPEVNISIGGRVFEVACQDGEQEFLESAAGLLDAEAAALAGQVGRLPESRMLLMSGLMLADKFVGIDEQIRQLERTIASQQAMIQELRARPAPSSERVEVPVIPAALASSLAELSAQAEALAEDMEQNAAAS